MSFGRWPVLLPFLLPVLLLAGCLPFVPATVPPQLSHTPGAPIVVIEASPREGSIDTSDFSMRYPAGWRVVKLSPASEPLRLALISPDEELRVQVSVLPLPTSTDTDQLTIEATRELSAVTVFLRGSAPPSRGDDLQNAFSFVHDSFSQPDAQHP